MNNKINAMWYPLEAIKRCHPSEIRGKYKKTRGLF